MNGVALLGRLTRQLDSAQREFVHLAETWLAQPAEPKSLHDLRVAWRRLRAVLDLLRREPTLAPSASAVKESMSALMRSSSAVRDLDVLLPQLRGWIEKSPELAPLGAVIATQRGERAAWFAAHWRQQQLLMASAMQALRQQLTVTSLPKNFYARGLARCEKRVRRAARHCDGANAQDWHHLRIRCKQWRYTLELADAAQGSRLRRLRRLQRHVGAAQDAASAISLLSQLACPALPPACLLAMGRQQCQLERQRIEALERARLKLSRLLDA